MISAPVEREPKLTEKKKNPKQEAAFQEELKQDRRRSAVSQRYQLVRDAIFLIIQATHRLQHSWQYYDCSQNPDFDDLQVELGCTPEQLGAKVDALLKEKEARNGRRKRSRSVKGKKRSQSK